MASVTEYSDKRYSNQWRQDIQGLRALAVVAVVLYHFNQSLLPGGFFGVDLFFVISGYLITHQIMTGKYGSGTSGFKKFILARFSRIYPALAFWTILFLCLFSFWLMPTYQSDYYYSAFFSLFFVLNDFLSYRAVDYFSPNFNLNPYLHLWSISIEVKFYVLFSFVIFLFLRLWKLLIFIIFFISCYFFFLSDYNVDFNYFSFFPRLIQFALGALSCFAATTSLYNQWRRYPIFIETLGGGFLVVTISLLYFGRDGIDATVFTAVSAGVLLCSSFVNRKLLSNSVFKWLGDRSYSIYLIHFPLLKFFEYYFDFTSIRLSDLSASAGYFFILMCLSAVSYKYIEKPNLRCFPSMRVLFHFASLVFFISILLVSFRSNLSPNNTLEKHFLNTSVLMSSEGDKIIKVVGDSHAQMLFPAFNEILSIDSSIRFEDHTGVGCLFGKDISFQYGGEKLSDCTLRMNSFIDNFRDGDNVFIANRALAYLSDSLISLADKPYDSINFAHVSKPIRDGQALIGYLAELRRIIEQAPNVNFYYLAPIPEMKVPTFKCVYNNQKPECRTSIQMQKAYRQVLLSGLVAIQDTNPNFHLFDLTDEICHDEVCSNVYNGDILYRDDDHLSAVFVGKLAPKFVQLLGN